MSEWEDCRNITIPISTAVIARAIHSILSAAVLSHSMVMNMMSECQWLCHSNYINWKVVRSVLVAV